MYKGYSISSFIFSVIVILSLCESSFFRHQSWGNEWNQAQGDINTRLMKSSRREFFAPIVDGVLSRLYEDSMEDKWERRLEESEEDQNGDDDNKEYDGEEEVEWTKDLEAFFQEEEEEEEEAESEKGDKTMYDGSYG